MLYLQILLQRSLNWLFRLQLWWFKNYISLYLLHWTLKSLTHCNIFYGKVTQREITGVVCYCSVLYKTPRYARTKPSHTLVLWPHVLKPQAWHFWPSTSGFYCYRRSPSLNETLELRVLYVWLTQWESGLCIIAQVDINNTEIHHDITSIRLNRGWLQCLNYVMLDQCSSQGNYQSTQSNDSLINISNYNGVAKALQSNSVITGICVHYKGLWHWITQNVQSESSS